MLIYWHDIIVMTHFCFGGCAYKEIYFSLFINCCSEIFPYLVIIVGLENVLVVTKSVVSTPVHLDVKLRVAKGMGYILSPSKKNIIVHFEN